MIRAWSKGKTRTICAQTDALLLKTDLNLGYIRTYKALVALTQGGGKVLGCPGYCDLAIDSMTMAPLIQFVPSVSARLLQPQASTISIDVSETMSAISMLSITIGNVSA